MITVPVDSREEVEGMHRNIRFFVPCTTFFPLFVPVIAAGAPYDDSHPENVRALHLILKSRPCACAFTIFSRLSSGLKTTPRHYHVQKTVHIQWCINAEARSEKIQCVVQPIIIAVLYLYTLKKTIELVMLSRLQYVLFHFSEHA